MTTQTFIWIVFCTAPIWFLGVAVWRLGTRLYEMHIQHDHHFDDEENDEADNWKKSEPS